MRKGLIKRTMTVILMHALSECRGFEESCVLIHTLFLGFPQKFTELQNAYSNELSDVSKRVLDYKLSVIIHEDQQY